MNTVDNDDLLPEPRPITGGRPGSLAEVVTVHDGLTIRHELVLAPGATATDLTTAMILVPPTACLVSHHGDVDVSLVFQEVTRPFPGGEEGRAEPGAGSLPQRRGLHHR
ncbi:hypothetical protein [Candidatus Frankia alpina]|uniref:Uncharacterized protein n=1 Tax=Candidatus Frankia alpina TaxID=2699483 RepID=A0A4S5EV09_9ACTN|nr:hypothetical protein [Candidatus Frankia alpina]THJ76356.1 hypothetical protein E7Y31_00250 [Candidatus Frankia alpina]